MGLFDLFKNKSNPLTEMVAIKTEIKESATKLQSVSKELENHLIRLEKLQNGHFTNLVEKVQHDIGKQREEIKNTGTILNDFDVRNIKDEDLNNLVKSASKNLHALNAVLEMELCDASSYMKDFGNFCHESASSMKGAKKLIEDLPLQTSNFNELSNRMETLINSIKNED